MENRENNYETFIRIANILRKTTKFVKIVPFVYALLFLLCMIPYWQCDEDILNIIDECFYVSPIVCLTFIRLSYYLKLCNWYRLQCCLPMFPLPVIIIDENIYEFGDEFGWINFAVTILIFLLSLINAYFVFIRPSRSL